MTPAHVFETLAALFAERAARYRFDARNLMRAGDVRASLRAERNSRKCREEALHAIVDAEEAKDRSAIVVGVAA